MYSSALKILAITLFSALVWADPAMAQNQTQQQAPNQTQTTTQTPAQPPAPAPRTVTKLTDRVYVWLGTGDTPADSFGANAGFIVGDDGVLVIDTLISAKQAQQFLAAIRTVTGKPVRWVVNTHHHLDHSFGNSVFARAGAVIIAQEKAAVVAQAYYDGVMARLGALGLTANDLEGTIMTPPSITFPDKLTINVGGAIAQVIYLGPTHSLDSVAVLIPENKILFTGDMLFTDYHPNLHDGDFDNWLAALDKLAAMGADTLVPGHGPLSTNKDLADMKAYMIAFDAAAREITAASPDTSDTPALAEKLKAKIPARSHLFFTIPYNLQKYLQK